MENLKEVIDLIEKSSQITEVTKETILKGYLEEVGEVEVVVGDRGEGSSPRWSVWARTLDLPTQRTAVSNSGDDLETVIATTHWYQLAR